MIRKKINELTGDEILSKPLMTLDYQIILPEGARLRPEYIEKFQELGVMEVWVTDEFYDESDALEVLKDNILSTVSQKVKDILERHTYQDNDELSELAITVENIMNSILEDKRILEEILNIRQRSSDLYEHSLNVTAFVMLTALKMKLDIKFIMEIGIGSLLHDIGLRYQPIDYFNRKLEDLNPLDVIEYKKHPVYGYEGLKEEDWLSKTSLNIILMHHECLDGSGFPLRSSHLPLECRIISVCDTFEEMFSGIGCESMKLYEIIEYFKHFKKFRYDEVIVDTFLSFIAVYPTGTRVVTNQGEEAVVVRQNKGFQERPVLRITQNAKGEEVTGIVIKDLVKVHNIFIEKVLD